MSTDAFKAKAYVKERCPFSFKFLVFMSEAGLLDSIELVRLKPGSPGYDAEKAKLDEGLGKPATFPTVEIEPGRYLTDSDRLIELFAERAGLKPAEMPVLAFYKETILPQLIELHQIKHPKTV
jgi:hypothetical protein